MGVYDGSIDRSSMSCKATRKRCKVCGEYFIYYPFWHQWMAKVNHSAYEAVCRYNCMRVIEKREEERRRQKEEAREQKYEEIKRKQLEAYHAKRKGLPVPELEPKKPRDKAWYEKRIEQCQMKHDEWMSEIKLKKNAGVWKQMDEPRRRSFTEKAGYYRRQLEKTKLEYEEWREANGYQRDEV